MVLHMVKSRKKQTCHDCGAEAIDECMGYTKGKRMGMTIYHPAFRQHIPAYPTQLPCRICLRNKETVGWYDMFSENWTFTMLGEGKVEPLIEDPTKPELRMLDIVARVTVKECCKQ